MIFIKTEEEIALMRESNMLVSKTHAMLAREVREGVTTNYLDKLAEAFIRDHGGIPGFLNYNGYPKSLCISVNDVVVHGIPSDNMLQFGDIVSVDCGVYKNGFHGDSAYTFVIGDISPQVQKLIDVTRECLFLGIEKAVAGNRTGDIGHAVQTHAEKNGFSVVRELVGHGVGRHLHEKPEVPNFGKSGQGVRLTENMVIAIEPMINMGRKEVKQMKDGWTIRTFDGKPSAHFEHSVVVRKNKAEILSDFEIIDKEIVRN
ncbi:MAG TPA: type I methionyl aminopeptidase [Bacteroidales bacterium]|nr:type I methionyl aminopeptidase [Bacteroidales bacterium]HQL70518.1 type I methionyl aminopeptidase [Bacteroidales bacterium]